MERPMETVFDHDAVEDPSVFEHRAVEPPSESQGFFSRKIIVITGAGGQFGREGCLYFARRGASICGIDMDLNALQGTFDALKNEVGPRLNCKLLICDVTNVVQVQLLVESIASSFGRIDMLWNNAGYQGLIKPTLDYDPADFAKVMNINVTGVFHVLQACARQMAKQSTTENGGSLFSIVNTASVAGLRGTPAMIAYSSSKAAVLAMTVTAAKDLAPHGIRVNSISPALIGPGKLWSRQNELHAASGSPYFDSDADKVAENKIKSVPLQRLGSVEEVLKSVAFLLSDESAYTTGSNLVVDGGLSSGLKA